MRWLEKASWSLGHAHLIVPLADPLSTHRKELELAGVVGEFTAGVPALSS